jgi:hypothetical protein
MTSQRERRGDRIEPVKLLLAVTDSSGWGLAALGLGVCWIIIRAALERRRAKRRADDTRTPDKGRPNERVELIEHIEQLLDRS